MKTLTFKAMGSKIFIAMETEDESTALEMNHAKVWFEEWENRFSRFKSDSELCQVNQRPGVPLKVTEEFLQVSQLALENEIFTGGLVSSAVLNALETAGYEDSFEKISSSVTKKDDRQKPSESVSHFFLNQEDHTILLGQDMRLDFGGFAKGWAAHQTMQRLSKFGPVLVDAGGDIAVSSRKDGGFWQIGLADPLNQGEIFEIIAVENCGVATSGTDYHRWTKNGQIQHHIIDPRTGRPAETDVLSVTVVAENVMDAEMHAKMAVILGSSDGMAWLENQGVSYWMVLDKGNVFSSETMMEKIWNHSILQSR